MTLDSWLRAAQADADRRNLPDLKPLLDTLARSTRRLREADFVGDAAGQESADGPQAGGGGRP